jgi:hypothetical protein
LQKEDELNSPLKIVLERQLAKKKPNLFSIEILKFFGVKDPYKKRCYATKTICARPCLFGWQKPSPHSIC